MDRERALPWLSALVGTVLRSRVGGILWQRLPLFDRARKVPADKSLPILFTPHHTSSFLQRGPGASPPKV